MLRMAMRAMADRDTNAHDLAKRLGITTTTLYMYVNGDGTVKTPGQKLLDAAEDAWARKAASPQRRHHARCEYWMPQGVPFLGRLYLRAIINSNGEAKVS